MGSYDCTTVVRDPMCSPTIVDFSENLVSEHKASPGSVSCLLEANSNEVDNCPIVSRDDVLLDNEIEPTGLVTQCENPDESILSNELYSKCGISGVSLDENLVETDACSMKSGKLMLCDKYGLSNTTDGFELTSEIIERDASSGFFILQNEENANSSVVGSPETIVKEVMDEKKLDLIEVEADTSGLLSPSWGSETSLKSMVPLINYCFQKNELEDTKPFNKFASPLRDHIEPLLSKGCDSVMHSVMDSGNIADKHVVGFSTEKIIEVVGLENGFDISRGTITPSMGCQKTDEILQHDDSLATITRQSDCMEEKSSIGSLGQSSAEVSKDCTHITKNPKVHVAKNAMPPDRNSNLKEGFITGNLISEKSASQELCHAFDVRDDGSSEMTSTKNISVGDATFLSSHIVCETSGQIDCGSRNNFGVDCVPEINCVDVVASTSGLSNVQRSKSVRKTRTGKSSKRSKSARKATHSCKNVQIIFEAARRKRTCLSKPSRSTIWGSLSCITQSSWVSSEFPIQQHQNQELMKGRKGRHRAKKNKKERKRRSKGSKQEKGSTSTGCLRLKVKLGKLDQSFLNIMIPDVDTSLSAAASNSNCETEPYWKTGFDFPKLTKHNECEVLEEATGKHLNSKENLDNLCCTHSSIQLANNVLLDSIITPKISLDQADESIGISSMIVESMNGESYTQPLDSGANDLTCSSLSKLSIEPFSLSKATVSVQDDVKIESSIAAKSSNENDYQCKLFGPTNLKDPLPSNSTSLKHSKSSKSGKAGKGRTKTSDSGKRSGNAPKQRDNQRKSVNKNKLKKVCDYAESNGVTCPESGNFIVNSIRKTSGIDDLVVKEVSNLNTVSDVLNGKYSPTKNAWVLCDDCQKWRRIPAGLVETIGQESCTWTCKDNTDKSFADCSIPQEKSNGEINAELEISDASGDDEASRARRTYRLSENQRAKVLQERGYTRIKSNHYLHRTRKSQTIDEVMICHCKAPFNGKLGCGDECLNRMLNIECNRGTCPCGDLCSNLQFQKRTYAKLGRLKCGKKGFGLQLLEDISEGQFLIEYVGEVLDMPAYEARQKEYAMNGHRHFYFMTLNCNEVIDASAKGNLGRFINHSCEPNCRTEKWMVNGEICIGLFTLRDIKKGEEVTFDYNYVRVFGAAAKKCYCGSSHCRGSIGGDPLDSGVIVQSDSDEDYLEPVMLLEDVKANDGLSTRASTFENTEALTVESISNTVDEVNAFTSHVALLDITKEQDEPLNVSDFTVPQLQSSLVYEKLMVKVPSAGQVLESSQQTDTTSKTMSTAHQDILVQSPSHKNSCIAEDIQPSCVNSMVSKSLSDGCDSDKKLDAVEHQRVSSKRRPLVKTSRKSGFVKKGNMNNDPLHSNKVPVLVNKLLSVKPKKIMEASGRFEAVEEKLNELLDTCGGISKRKDAAKGYLKLLLLTAASGDRVSGEAIQSNRDLSMILDALLKTKSRVVLTDIINKNGLQMLHNMMKQYRCDFKKIPILRKLLKVLEYLAVKEIVSSEHVNAGPRCLGMESFAESMLSLTEHDDKQVHHIARKFRDRWIHRPLRKFIKERDDGRMELYKGPTETIDGVKQLVVADAAIHNNVGSGYSVSPMNDQIDTPKPRKRKSRWDQPTASTAESRALQPMEQKLESGLSNVVADVMVVCGDKVNSSVESNSLVHNFCQHHKTKLDDGDLNNTDDVPPGFSSPLYSIESSNASPAAVDLPQSINGLTKCFSTVAGHLQEKFISRLPVSYGVPLSIVQQFGTSQAENLENWIIAPGMPFHPFPPLPPSNQEKKATPPSHAPIKKRPNEKHWDNCGLHTSYEGESSHGSVVSNQPFLDGPPGSNQQPTKRARGSTYDLGKRH